MIIGESDLVLIPAEATRSIAIVDFARSEEVAPIYYTVLITMPRAAADRKSDCPLLTGKI